jgi:hypothetical protein
MAPPMHSIWGSVFAENDGRRLGQSLLFLWRHQDGARVSAKADVYGQFRLAQGPGAWAVLGRRLRRSRGSTQGTLNSRSRRAPPTRYL